MNRIDFKFVIFLCFSCVLLKNALTPSPFPVPFSPFTFFHVTRLSPYLIDVFPFVVFVAVVDECVGVTHLLTAIMFAGSLQVIWIIKAMSRHHHRLQFDILKQWIVSNLIRFETWYTCKLIGVINRFQELISPVHRGKWISWLTFVFNFKKRNQFFKVEEEKNND